MTPPRAEKTAQRRLSRAAKRLALGLKPIGSTHLNAPTASKDAPGAVPINWYAPYKSKAEYLAKTKARKAAKKAKRKALSAGKPKLKSRKWLIRNLDLAVGKEAKHEYRKNYGDWCMFCDFRGVTREPVTVWFHMLSRGHYSTRWDKWNSVASCNDCNLIYERDPEFIAKVVAWYKEKFGQERWDALYKLWHKSEPVSTVDMRALWDKFSPNPLPASVDVPKP